MLHNTVLEALNHNVGSHWRDETMRESHVLVKLSKMLDELQTKRFPRLVAPLYYFKHISCPLMNW